MSAKKINEKNMISFAIFLMAIIVIVFFDLEKIINGVTNHINYKNNDIVNVSMSNDTTLNLKNNFIFEEKANMTAGDHKLFTLSTVSTTSSISTNFKNDDKTIQYSIVDEDYFNNSLFIGDSRTEGFMMYKKLKGAIYYCDRTYGVYAGFDVKKDIKGVGEFTLNEILNKYTFDKIYVCLGMNNVTLNKAHHKKTYYSYLTHIKELQPNAIIYILSNMHITKKSKPIDFNNDDINQINNFLKDFADDKTIYYLDTTTIYDDEDGYLKNEYSYDGWHIKIEYYDKYLEFLETHAIVK